MSTIPSDGLQYIHNHADESFSKPQLEVLSLGLGFKVPLTDEKKIPTQVQFEQM